MPHARAVDRTFRAVSRQLRGMRCPTYEVGIRTQTTGQMMIQRYTHEQVLRSVGFLKSKNANGADIYIRPVGSQGIILVDDVPEAAITRMKQDRVTPACIVETSPGNFQVWVRVSETAIPAPVATRIARHLALTYDGDPNSADFRHFGWLAGFTNRKPLYVALYERAPFVLVHVWQGLPAEAGIDLLQQEAPSPSLSPPATAVQTTSTIAPDAFYQSQLAFYESRYGNFLDVSRADWAIVGKMLAHGLDESTIADMLLRCSPALQERKKGHIEDYIDRTIRKRARQKP